MSCSSWICNSAIKKQIAIVLLYQAFFCHQIFFNLSMYCNRIKLHLQWSHKKNKKAPKLLILDKRPFRPRDLCYSECHLGLSMLHLTVQCKWQCKDAPPVPPQHGKDKQASRQKRMSENRFLFFHISGLEISCHFLVSHSELTMAHKRN